MKNLAGFTIIALSLLLSNVQADVQFVKTFSALWFEQPVLITHAGDGSNRLFVVEQGGTIQQFQNSPNVQEAEAFFDIEKAAQNRFLKGGEQGLLGLAFDPEFESNGRFYVNYTASRPRRTVIARYEVNGSGAVDYGSETVLLEVNQDYANHNGGMIAFGPDGYLYIGMGDGGSGGDPKNRAQDPRSLLGKMLRVDTDGRAPRDNPFVRDNETRDEIWALGLRNPWRFSFDRKTGYLWAGDVGQNEVEEISIIEAGNNYGWRPYEGTQVFNRSEISKVGEHIPPVFEYTHDQGRSVTGGVVYRGTAYPNLNGWYFFGDFVSGRMWGLETQSKDVVSLPNVPNPAAFGEDEAGELYVVSYRGNVYQIVDR